MSKKRKIIMLDEIPPSFKRKIQKKRKLAVNTVCPTITCEDTSGTLLRPDKWRSIWHYRNYHVRVISSTNPHVKEDTVFISSKYAAITLQCGEYHNIHKAIINDKPLSGCFLEYTNKIN